MDKQEIEPVGSSSPVATKVLACPKCGAPSDMESLGSGTGQAITCLFCDTVYTLQQSQDDALERERSLKAWVEQKITGISVSGAGGIDVGTRSFLFNKDFYPDLKKDVDRRLEDLENAPEIPMIPFQALAGFPDYQPNPLLVTLGQGDNQWLKTLSTRLSAQQVQDFATMDVDQLRLKTLLFRINSLIYYANVANLLRSGEASALHVARQNVQALQKVYQAFSQEITDESYRSYLLALHARLEGAALLLDILVPVLEEGRSFTPEAALAQIERSLTQYQKADQQTSICTYNPLYTIPLQQGIHKDIMVARIIQAIVKCYEMALHINSVDFRPFCAHVLQYLRSLAPAQSFAQLLGLLDALQRMLSARAGEVPLPVINEWSWLQAAIGANVRKPAFSAPETVGTVTRHLHPYWVATLNYAEKQGVIFKSGTGRSALILVDATSVNAPIVGCLLTNDPLLPIIHQGTNNFNALDKQLMAVPALVSRDRAEQMMKQYANQRASELGTTSVKMLDIIYLPVAHVQYLGKNQQREMLVSRLSFVNQQLGNVLAQTYQFFQQYGI